MARAQPHWVRDLAGTGNEHIADVQVDADGAIYVTGEYGGAVTFGGQTLPGFGGIDAFVARLTPDGNVVWCVRGGGSGIDRGMKLSVGPGDKLAVTGEFMGVANLFGTTLASAGGTADVFVAVLEKSTGALNWVLKGGGPAGTDSPGGVSMGPDGRVTVAGEFRGTAQWEGSSLTSAGDVDVFIATYSPAGALLWLKHGAASAADRAVDVVHDAAGGLYVAGQFSNDITFDQTYPNVLVNAGFLLRLDAGGNEIWFRRFGGATFNHVRDLVMDGPSRVLVLGDLQGTMVWSGPPAVNVAGGGDHAYFLMAVDANGSLQGQATVASENNVSVRGMAVGNGTVAVLGEFDCRFTGLATHHGGEGLFMATGSGDLFVALHAASSLQLQEGQQFAGRQGKQPGGIGIMPGGDPVFSGSFQNELIFPVVPGFQADVTTQAGSLMGNGVGAYCNDLNYGSYAASLSDGLFDGFVARAYVQGREPYDWWMRPTGDCDRTERQPCIRRGGSGECQDTITACSSVSLGVDLRSSHLPGVNDRYLGPPVSYQWSTGSTAPTLAVTTSGTYWVTVTSANGCWQWTDTVEVIIDPLPPAPLVHDDVVVNSGTSFPNMIPLCDPETHWVWATNIPPDHTFWWTYPFSGGEQLYNDSIMVDTTGSYTINVMSPNGCIRSVSVYVEDSPDTPMPDLDVSLTFVYPQDIDQNDTISVCVGSEAWLTYTPTWTINGVAVDELPPGIMVEWNVSPAPPTFPTPGGPENYSFTPSGPGWYVSEVVLRVHNAPCGDDTLYFSGIDSIYVELFPPLNVEVSLSGPTAVCSGDTIVLTAGCTGCASVTWTGDQVGIIDEWNVAVWQGGQYTVTANATDTNGCVYSDALTLTVVMPQGPVLEIDPPDGILCPGTTATIQTSTAGTDHVWYGPLGPITGQGGSFTTDVPGSYYLSMTVAGCPVSSNSVTIENYGTPYIAFNEPPVLCHPGDQVTITVNTTSSATIAWGAPLSGNAPSQVITAPGTYTCSVTACGITTPLSIEVPYAPVTAQVEGTGPYTFCPGDSLVLNALPGADTYLWLPDEVPGPQLTVSQSGDVWLVVSNTAGCTDTSAVVHITGIAFPEPLVATGDTICAGDMAQLFATGSGEPIWYADPLYAQAIGAGSPFSLTAWSDTVVYVRQELSGCVGDHMQVCVEVIPRPTAITILGPDSLCLGDELLLSVVGPDTVQYQWTTPAGAQSGAQIGVPDVDENAAGTYACIPSYQGCTGPGAVHTLIVHVPVELDLPEESLLCLGGALTITVPADHTGVHWSNGSTASSITFTSSAQVEVEANDVHGCPVHAFVEVVAIECDIEVPNVFTPNGDGTNDGWLPAGGFVKANARIWNRWGGLVYEGDMLQRPWNGRHYTSGEPCTDGVYYYELELVRADGSVKPLAGYLHLLR
jgi:gliding motility-associated-like protein